MTIGAWILYAFLCFLILIAGFALGEQTDHKGITMMIAIFLCIALFFGFRWYFTSTASGIRALTDQRSELQNGLDRIINIYTADGTILAHYEGKIDLEADQDYVKFDWKGKRYIYYNCFIETIATIP